MMGAPSLPSLLLLLALLFSGAPPSSAFQLPAAPPLRPRRRALLRRPRTIMGAALSDDARGDFRDKSILITGASRGLGRSLARKIAACRPSLLILSGRDEAALEEVRGECAAIADRTQKVEIVACDLADKGSVGRLAAESLRLAQGCPSGVVDVLINNGGISSRSSFLETKLDVDERLMQVNFFSGAELAKGLVPGMVDQRGGRVIWISSIQGKLGTPYRTSYAASKFAVQGYCEALRSELASDNVSVHIVSPGYIRTNLSMSAVMGDGKAYSKMDDTTENGAINFWLVECYVGPILQLMLLFLAYQQVRIPMKWQSTF
ncbi:hypothetical protein ACHAWF_015945 [Thalassiosira exigua]